MKIAFVTTQSLAGSTIVGRVLPLAEELGRRDEIHILGHGQGEGRWHSVGKDPFRRTSSGKIRQAGVRLVFTMVKNAITSAFVLVRLKTDVIIIVKSLPENVLAVWLARTFIRPKKIILDVDDFELTALVLTSLTHRAAIHWAERMGASMSSYIVTATPFLSDHFEQLTQGKKPITMIPTGLTVPYLRGTGSATSEVSRLIYAGSLSVASGHRIDLLPEIFAEVRKQCPNVELHVYGTGDDEKLLKKEGIILHGRFDLNAISFATQPFKKGWVFIDPIDSSIANRAKSSFRVALAAVLGRPVVTSDIGIRPYLLPDSLHFRCFAKPGDAKDYAEKIITFLQSPLTPAEQESLKNHARQFTWVRLEEKYANIIASE